METTIFRGQTVSFRECSVPTVDGSEIRRSPVEVGSLSHYLQGFISGIIRFIKLAILGGIKQCNSPY